MDNQKIIAEIIQEVKEIMGSEDTESFFPRVGRQNLKFFQCPKILK